MIKIVVDGSADMPEEWKEKYDVHILPLNIHFGNRQYIQGVDLSMAEFYRMVNQNRVIPKTSLPSPQQIAEFYSKLAKKGETILSIHVGSKMSGTFAAAQMAARDLLGIYNVVPIDSASGSAVLAFMTKEAREMERCGASLDDILQRLDYIRKNAVLVFTLDNLEFARMSGRVSALQERLTTILQIKPIILLKDGMLDMADKVRTRSRSIDRMIEMVRERVGGKLVNAAVIHAADLVTGQAIMEKISSIFNIEEAFLTELSVAVAANLGPHTVGIVAYPLEDQSKRGR